MEKKKAGKDRGEEKKDGRHEGLLLAIKKKLEYVSIGRKGTDSFDIQERKTAPKSKKKERR